MLMSVFRMPWGRGNTESHLDFGVLYCCLKPCLCLRTALPPGVKHMWVAILPATWDVDVHSLCCHHGSCLGLGTILCTWFILQLDAMLRGLCYVRGQVDAHNLDCLQKAHGSPWSMFLITIKDNQASFIVVSMT